MEQITLRALGIAQRRTLAMMLDRGGEWYPGCGWAPQKTRTDSIRTLTSLTDRGMTKPVTRHDPRGSYTAWELTDTGRAAARTL